MKTDSVCVFYIMLNGFTFSRHPSFTDTDRRLSEGVRSVSLASYQIISHTVLIVAS